MAIEASLLRRHAPTEVADLFVASRIERDGTGEFGTLPSAGAILSRIADRAVPQ
jgi:putative acyl-CoA dehydrogenase